MIIFLNKLLVPYLFVLGDIIDSEVAVSVHAGGLPAGGVRNLVVSFRNYLLENK